MQKDECKVKSKQHTRAQKAGGTNKKRSRKTIWRSKRDAQCQAGSVHHLSAIRFSIDVL